jgi:sugar (pentulose or hexulose) kinase
MGEASVTTATASRPDPLAVFDLGKTNSKLFVFSPDGAILDERRTKPEWIEHRGRSVLDEARLFAWMREELAGAVERHGVARLTVSAHGCAFALVRGAGALQHPILDYEQEIPQAVAEKIDPILPDFSESYAPHLPLGFCIARQIAWLEQEEPRAFAGADAILCYPQYWVWRFTGRQVGEYSYLGAHTQLWAPLKRDYSSLVNRLGWRPKFPPLAPAGAVVGETAVRLADGTERRVVVHNGVHDSNAALAYYRMTGLHDFTIVSTGTWVILINLACPLTALDAGRDMICNVTVNGEPAPSLRFMGGREYDLISGGWNEPITQAAVECVMARGVFALPSWTAGGPFPEIEGRIVGGEVEGEERAAVAALYVLMMTDLSLDLMRSANRIVVDGGLAKIDLYTAMLAQLRPAQAILRSAMSEGSATGAAALAFKALGLNPFHDETESVAASRIAGLEAYRDRWRELADAARAKARHADTLEPTP